MRAVTHCPACQTEFFVTDEQLNKHNGKVRCGQCLHVFDAKAEFVEPGESAEAIEDTPPAVPNEENVATAPVAESSAKAEDEFIGDYQLSNFDDLADKSKLKSSRKRKPRPFLWSFISLILLIAAIAQSIYFMRSEIAIYYPNFKPYLVKACIPLHCTVELPKKIEFIVIDDSDIQEDAEYKGLMRLSSTLINQASFNQAYPKLELTLTDVEDKPKLRRIFTPKEYLPEHTDISRGLAPGEEVKIRLAMTTQGESVAGYRVYVSY